MKVLGLSSSVRKGNSQGLLQAVLDGAKEAGAEVELIRLADKDIKPCKGCGYCKAEGHTTCVTKDDMQEIYKKIAEADAVVLGSPVYFGRPNSIALCMVERMYAMVDAKFASHIKAGKNFASVQTCGSNGADVTDAIHASLAGAFSFFGMKDAGHVWANNCYAQDDFSKDTAKIAEAKKLGKKLAE
ncbi:MAG: flavodoxin family protein [Methanocorpusculum sp.]|nr:flavodoxin family protein [Methanocorpusculum sp.]